MGDEDSSSSSPSTSSDLEAILEAQKNFTLSARSSAAVKALERGNIGKAKEDGVGRRVNTPEMFSEAPICVSMRKEGSLCQFLPIQRQIIVVRIEIMTSVLDPQCEFEQSEQGVEDPSRIQGKLGFWCDLV
ncbi:hypothetical protein P5673_005176 [Acropora cervicornis]|uniref:Uncharacterized protein n=1 Tax=Acropora cervicornis TaxID=6130 RepID=A0AAD9VDU5_ACRCE|nr:hypothetical protein P5673_005176 [Acropora cervicornis]